MSTRRVVLPIVITMLLLSGREAWSASTSKPSATKPGVTAAATRTTILPARFLRRFDPVTVLFHEPVGPAKAGPEDRGRAYFRIRPPRPGAYRWLDAKTLEFRPADPWPALGRFLVTVNKGLRSRDGKTAIRSAVQILGTLLPQPIRMKPSPGAENVGRIRQVVLTFAQPLPTRALHRCLSLTLKPLPGVDGAGRTVRVAGKQLSLKQLPRSSRKGAVSYLVNLARPLPTGTRVSVALRLVLRGRRGVKAPSWSASFSTRPPFQLLTVRCHRSALNVSWGSSRMPQNRALDCGGKGARPTLVFSRAPGRVSPGLLRRLVRLSPSVPGLRVQTRGRRLVFKGRYRRDVLYRMTIDPTGLPIRCIHGQPLHHRGTFTLFFYLGKRRPFLRWERGKGVLERYGPRMMPLRSRRTLSATRRTSAN